LPNSLRTNLARDGVPAAKAEAIANEPPVGSLFAAFLGYNPMEKLVGQDTLAALPKAQADDIVGKQFFPKLISDPFIDGLRIAFTSSLVMCLIAAAASWMRGAQHVFGEDERVEMPVEEWVPA
jgi:hypothetical protein